MDVREQYAYLRPQPMAWVVIWSSVVIHGLLIGLLVIGGLLEDLSPPKEQNVMITRLLRKGKKRPDNWLPRKDASPPPPAPRAAAPVQTQTPTPAKPAETKPAQQPRQDLSKDMNQALAALAHEYKNEEREGSEEGVEEGDSLVAQKGAEYETKVYKAIKSNYVVPELISARERMFLAATVVITLNAQGQLKDLTFEKRSGNDLYDSAVESAIRRASPFPPPPAELASNYARVGIGLNFRAAKM